MWVGRLDFGMGKNPYLEINRPVWGYLTVGCLKFVYSGTVWVGGLNPPMFVGGWDA